MSTRHSKPRVLGSGRLSESYGDRGFTVRLWEREPGGVVMLQWGKPAEYESLGYAVRSRDRKGRWDWDMETLARARDAAKDRSASLRIGTSRKEATPEALTVEEAFSLFLDEDTGGTRDLSQSAVRNYRIAEREWVAFLGPDRPWNRILPADVEALAFRVAAKHPSKAQMMVKNLRSVRNWLATKRRMRGLENPTEFFPWEDLSKLIKPKQERYTEAEMEKLLAVRDDIDPRFALMLVIAAEAGPRSKAIRLWMRSHLDAPIRPEPTPEQAPNGWTYLPALKGQEPPLIFLTAFARREIDKALTGYLRELEARWQDEGIDYPMIPGARIADATDKVVRLDQPGADRPIGDNNPKSWLRDAERVAKVKHVTRRGWHGLRRLWTDRVEDTAGLDVAAVAGAWADRTMVERIYRSKSQFGKLSRAREALDKGPENTRKE